MDEVATKEVAVGDEVRVHFHPPGPMKSFFEGVSGEQSWQAQKGASSRWR